MQFTVVIPTHNRPELLLEAVASVAAQTLRNWHVVVVDDGSTPPVRAERLHEITEGKLSLLRHEQPLGIACAKNAGAAAAEGDAIVFLDDDDLLVADALERLADVFAGEPVLDCAFMNVRPFGRHATVAAANQERAVAGVLRRSHGVAAGGLVVFGEALFDGLLASVPVAFQRMAVRRAAWVASGGYEPTLAYPEPCWAMRASLTLACAFVTDALSLWRVDGQNYMSVPANDWLLRSSVVETKRILLADLASRGADYDRQRAKVRQDLSQQYFGLAHWCRHRGERVRSLKFLVLSLAAAPLGSGLRLMVRYLLRTGREPGAGT